MHKHCRIKGHQLSFKGKPQFYQAFHTQPSDVFILKDNCPKCASVVNAAEFKWMQNKQPAQPGNQLAIPPSFFKRHINCTHRVSGIFQPGQGMQGAKAEGTQPPLFSASRRLTCPIRAAHTPRLKGKAAPRTEQILQGNSNYSRGLGINRRKGWSVGRKRSNWQKSCILQILLPIWFPLQPLSKHHRHQQP